MNSINPVSAPYYNIGQQRIDLWNQLKRESAELVKDAGQPSAEDLHIEEIESLLALLEDIEHYFAFPGLVGLEQLKNLLQKDEHAAFANHVVETIRQLVSDGYRSHPDFLHEDEHTLEITEEYESTEGDHKNYFEVLIVEDLSVRDETLLRQRLADLNQSSEQFTYGIVVQRSFQDALIALTFNFNIQAVVVRYAPVYGSERITEAMRPYIRNVLNIDRSELDEAELGPELAHIAKQYRPELDLYYITDTPLSELDNITIKSFNRIFYRREDLHEIHLSIIRGIQDRYETPFFTALKEYSQKPTGIFHALPISRGNSVFKSRWIRDFGKFYGRNMFLAETSATTGGLDSLLQPTGPLKKAQEMASKAYGSQFSFFVTNGTSTANKIVMQALVKPGDVIMVDRDCHKSHHYALVLSGAYPVYLDSYPIQIYSMYGAVPLEEIKRKLLNLKAAGRLDKVKMLLLTNCTFNGIVYHVERLMEEVLAIKPDMIFLWDEAWFAFAGFTYTYRQRTGMYCAKKLYNKYKSEHYRKEYQDHLKNLKEGEVASLPDPDQVKLRVYATQSTHKTLSSFRQASMIHIWDEDYRSKCENAFLEAYMTHTSTSPNYQMLASLDAGRRQVQFEGFELVEKSIELAMILRAKINDNPKLNRYFDVLSVRDFIPDYLRETGLSKYYDKGGGWVRMEQSWELDEFVLDPTKITLHIGRTGVDGDTFKNKYLMDKYHIQINKTSRNTVLFMTTIGTTRGSVTYLTNALLSIAEELDASEHALNSQEKLIHKNRIQSLTDQVPPLPDFSHFHESFQAVPGVPGGNLREAFFLAYDEANYEYITLEDCIPAMQDGKVLVSSSFVTPYPPGFPVLVPGQMISEEIIDFLSVLDVSEIHGYRADLGLRIFKDSILDRQKTRSSMGALGKSSMMPQSKSSIRSSK